MAATTDAAYNAVSRMIECKLDFYFNGNDAAPTSITQNDYLVSWQVLEEVSSDTSAPFSTVSANELSFELANKGNAFSPLNKESPFYEKIKTGVKVAVYVRPVANVEYDWDPLGVFYLSEWQTGFMGQTISGTATDKISDIINATRIKMPVYKNISYNDFIKKFFTKLNIDITLDEALTGQLRFGYHIEQNADFLDNVAGGLQVFIFCDHTGGIVNRYMHKTVEVTHTITDNDQLVEPTTKQSITLQYDGASVSAEIPQLSEVTTVFTESEIENTKKTTYSDRNFTNKPVVNLAYSLATGDTLPEINSVRHNATELTFDLTNSFKGRIEFCGQYIETTEISREDPDCKNSLKFSSLYIQTEEYLDAFKKFMDAYVDNILPIIELTVKGNPRFKLGEKITVKSNYYHLDFTGILIRQELKFDGGLSGVLTLLNASILEVST